MGVMLDCPDGKELARSTRIPRQALYVPGGVAMIGEDAVQPVMFQQITGYHAPRRPDLACLHQLVASRHCDRRRRRCRGRMPKLGAASLSSGGVKLAGLRRPGRQAVLPLLGLAS